MEWEKIEFVSHKTIAGFDREAKVKVKRVSGRGYLQTYMWRWYAKFGKKTASGLSCSVEGAIKESHEKIEELVTKTVAEVYARRQEATK